MVVRFRDDKLDQRETDASYNAGFSQAVVTAFRKRMQQIRAATDIRDLYANKGMHFEKLAGARSHQHSIRLNNQFRLILELEEDKAGKVAVIVAIEDYH